MSIFESILVAASIIGFGKAEVNEGKDKQFIDPRIESVVCEYINTLEAEGIEVPNPDIFIVGFSKKMNLPNALGLAYGMDNIYTLIALDPSILNYSSNAKKWVVFHELTHDLFDMRHGSCALMHYGMTGEVTFADLDHAMTELIYILKNKQK